MQTSAHQPRFVSSVSFRKRDEAGTQQFSNSLPICFGDISARADMKSPVRGATLSSSNRPAASTLGCQNIGTRNVVRTKSTDGELDEAEEFCDKKESTTF
ncbi:hypothetical protein PoB_002752600 [Plakobranchus ocellatus]|uniref:Uncharacterized protein n=1 Tax=Plakobranchus ocellatus TaxID=259542 RepID=A0AAV4A2U3_9GAST|nr:hypothetical protein PoB_002752600 [Plakobranchus ocellatus]